MKYNLLQNKISKLLRLMCNPVSLLQMSSHEHSEEVLKYRALRMRLIKRK